MSKALLVTGNKDEPPSLAAGATRYFIAATGSLVLNATEANKQITYQQGGVLSNLYIQIATNTVVGASTFKIRKNGADGSESVSITGLTSGEFEDTTNTDTVSVGDEVNYQIIGGAGGTNLSIGVASIVFNATSNTVCILGTGDSASLSTDSTTRYFGLIGAVGQTTTEINRNYQFSNSGTLENLFVYVSANARTTNTIFRTRKSNSTNGAMSVTYGSGVTGILEDTSNTDTVTAGELWNYAIVTSTGAAETITYETVKSEMTTVDSSFNLGSVSNGFVSNADTVYLPMSGFTNPGANTEATVKTEANFAFTMSNLWMYISTAQASPCVTTFRLNGADTLLATSTVSSGEVEDTTHQIAVAATDEINFKIVTTASGWVVQGISFLAGPAVASAVTRFNHLTLLGVS